MEEKGAQHESGFSERDAFKDARQSTRRRRARAVRVAEGSHADVCEAIRRTRPRNHRICDLGRSACGDCDYRDHCLQAQARRIVERDLKRHQQLVADERGQSTVEYALVFTAFLGVVAGAGAIMGAVGDGLFVQHAVTSASHCLTSSVAALTDVFCF